MVSIAKVYPSESWDIQRPESAVLKDESDVADLSNSITKRMLWFCPAKHNVLVNKIIAKVPANLNLSAGITITTFDSEDNIKDKITIDDFELKTVEDFAFYTPQIVTIGTSSYIHWPLLLDGQPLHLTDGDYILVEAEADGFVPDSNIFFRIIYDKLTL